MVQVQLPLHNTIILRIMEEKVNIIKLPTDWGEVRERAAVQVLPKCIERVDRMFKETDEVSKMRHATRDAVYYADELVQRLKKTSCLTPTEVAIVDEIISALQAYGARNLICFDKEIAWLKMQKGNGAE